MSDFFDDHLGRITVKRNSRAKRVIVRRKNNVIEMTVPKLMRDNDIKRCFNELKPRILKLPVREIAKINESSQIKSLTFNVCITREGVYANRIGMGLKQGTLTIDVPNEYDINSDKIQAIIRDLIIHALRHEAKRVLPPKVFAFANKHNLQVNSVKINNSKRRWGSCNNKKNINLSLFSMMLPERLIDYVILHELAHTIELNHSPAFWQLLDKFCDGKAQELDRESSYWNDDYLYSLKQ